MKAVNIDASSFPNPFETMPDPSLEVERLQIENDELRADRDRLYAAFCDEETRAGIATQEVLSLREKLSRVVAELREWKHIAANRSEVGASAANERDRMAAALSQAKECHVHWLEFAQGQNAERAKVYRSCARDLGEAIALATQQPVDREAK